jgi:hypothetical protein
MYILIFVYGEVVNNYIYKDILYNKKNYYICTAKRVDKIIIPDR